MNDELTFNNTSAFVPATSLPRFVKLPKVRPGDKVSIVASSAQIAARFPHVYDFGIERMKVFFSLIAKEYPTTRGSGASLKERAADLMAAFSDAETKAVISLIGGNEQLHLLRYLDPEVLTKNPKPFFGYSDNTNFSLYLWSLGIPSFYGGCLFTEYAMSGKLNQFTENYLRRALFEGGEVEIFCSDAFSDQDLLWDEPKNLQFDYEYEPNDGWFWDGTNSASGILWGGCLESLGLQLKVGKWLPHPQAVIGTVLCLETSELIPEPWYVSDFLVGMGERGYLSNLSALIVARPKSRAIFVKEPPVADRSNYRSRQRETIIKEFRRYNSKAPVVLNVDFGHTKPQIPMPFGQKAIVDGQAQKVWLTF
jgi:muramoyltetrapeptide carboxypeptidase LdcA involved in peptidoglycan recycling